MSVLRVMLIKEEFLQTAIDMAVRNYVFPNGSKVERVESITIQNYHPDGIDSSMLEKCEGGTFVCNIRVENKMDDLDGNCSDIRMFNNCTFSVISYTDEKFEVNINIK